MHVLPGWNNLARSGFIGFIGVGVGENFEEHLETEQSVRPAHCRMTRLPAMRWNRRLIEQSRIKPEEKIKPSQHGGFVRRRNNYSPCCLTSWRDQRMGRAHGVRGRTRSSAATQRNHMKNQAALKKFSWLVAICFGSALALSACKNTGEHPKAEHPKKEHPATNAPPRNP